MKRTVTIETQIIDADTTLLSVSSRVDQTGADLRLVIPHDSQFVEEMIESVTSLRSFEGLFGVPNPTGDTDRPPPPPSPAPPAEGNDP